MFDVEVKPFTDYFDTQEEEEEQAPTEEVEVKGELNALEALLEPI
jgi:hypothetical protein